MLTLDMVREAQEALRGIARRTPLDRAPKFGENVYIKAENLQLTGAFKLRGAYNKIRSLTPEEAARGVIACSAGNHAQGIALSASRLGIKAVICMPAGAPISKVEATRGYGAEVVLVPGVYDDAAAEAERLTKEQGYTFAHPFNDPLVIAGQGTIGLEILEQLPDVEQIVVPIGGGGLIILSQATLSDVVPPRKLGTYMGVIGAVFAVSNVLGPLLGGWFVQVTGWRWIFWFTVPVALLAVVVLGLTLPRDARALGKHPIDWPGMMAMTVAVTSLVLAMAWGGTLIPWGSLPFMGLVALAVAAAVVFVLLERRAAEPIIPMGLFRNRNFVLCSVTGLFLNISFMGALNYLPTYFQIVDDLSPEVAGLVCTATSVGILITSTATGWVASKTGRYKGMLVAMCVVSTVGLFLLSRMQVHEALWVPVLYLFVLGFGMGLGMQLLVLVVQNEFPHAMVGTATAANNFFRQIGASVGTALVGALFTMRLTADVAGKLTHVDNLSLATLTPQIVDKLPASAQSVIAAGYSDALLPLFLWFVPLMLACLVMMLLLKRHPLATTINHGGAGK